ncbi:MAG: CcmD family protein [Chloroflexi bacterium]|nr:CcmD family protein [Chloroflexota bacterium]MCH8897136.1 CcmD family protein [Chloroflexota bacterium]
MFTLLQVNIPPSNLPFLFAVFAVTWVVFFAYAFFISRRRQEVQREIQDLRQALEEDARPAEAQSVEES